MIDNTKMVPSVPNLSPFNTVKKKIKLKPNVRVVPAPSEAPKKLGTISGTSLGSRSGTTSGVTIQGKNASFRQALQQFEKLAKSLTPQELNKISLEILETMTEKKEGHLQCPSFY